MSALRRVCLLAAALAAVGGLGCSSDNDFVAPTGGDLFRSYVSLGNSITAGYQSDGINDSTQRQAYPVLIANSTQSRFALPLIPRPGCAPPLVAFGSAERVGGGTSSTCTLRDPSSFTSVINNVAVPGARALDPTSYTTASSNLLTQLILGGATQAQRAVLADPSFVSIWIGNNDVLAASVSGLLTAVPGISQGLTPVDSFTARYQRMLDELGQAKHVKGGTLIAVVNAVIVPVLIAAPYLQLINPSSPAFNPQAYAAVNFATGCDVSNGGSCPGGPVQIHSSCTPTSTSLISLLIVPAIRTFRADNTDPSGHPPIIACAKGQSGLPPLVGDIFVLDIDEQAAVSSAVIAYNEYIQSKATELGWAYWDPNPVLVAAKASGAIPPLPDFRPGAAQPFGPYFSFDGIHPSAAAHVLFADSLLTNINGKYGKNYPLPGQMLTASTPLR